MTTSFKPYRCHRGEALAIVALSLLIAGCATKAPEALPTAELQPGERLFDAHELIALRIEAPLGSIERERYGNAPYHPAVLEYRS